MNLQSFGKTGLSLPPIVFGSSALGNLFHEYPTSLKKEILAEIFRLTAPHTVFDTAGKYGAGLALEVLGDFLHEQKINKKEVIITNKLGWVRTELMEVEPTFEPGIWKGLLHDSVQKIGFDGILECFEKDKDLLRQYIPQLVSVHDPDEYLAGGKSKAEKEHRWEEILLAYKALGKLKSEGKIKGIGVGAKDWRIIRDIYQHIDLDYVMLANSLTLISHPPDLLQFVDVLRKEQVGIINAAVFQSGFLVGEDYFNYKLIDPKNPSDQVKIQWRDQFFETCRQHDVSPDHACIQFALRVPGISSVALSINDPILVSKNIRAVKEELHQDFWDEMKNRKLIPDFAFL